jgi:uncharacterized protein (TIGR03000 family)
MTPVPYARVPSAQPTPVQPIAPAKVEDGQNRARINVKLPSNAKLWVDNVNCPLISNERSFNTPALVPGRQYFYTMRMDVEKDGNVVSENRRVFVEAGAQVNVDFNAPATFTAQR